MTPWKPRKALGQNFLVDSRAVERILEALAIRPGEPVLEIGPGRGALTARLIQAAGRATAVELDPFLAERLAERFDDGRLHLITGDVLRLDFSAMFRDTPGDPRRGLVVAGNLPYGISKPVASKLVRERATVDRAVLMFQKEVADRLTARPGSRSYAPLTVLAGRAYRIETLFDLAPGSFRPRPKVVSTVTMWRRATDRPFGDAEERTLRACLAASFAARRRTLRNNLRAALSSDAADRLLERADIDGALRAEQISPGEFDRLASLWPETERTTPAPLL